MASMQVLGDCSLLLFSYLFFMIYAAARLIKFELEKLKVFNDYS